MSDVTFHHWTDEPVCVVAVTGDMGLRDVPVVLTALTDALTAAPHRVVVCDVSDLAAPMTESVLAAFPAALRHAGSWPHCSLHLAGPGPELARRFRRLRMHRYLPVHATLSDALGVASADRSDTALRLVLEPSPSSLRSARDAVRRVWAGQDPADSDLAALVADELASNAIKHVGEAFTLTVLDGADRLLVAVTDHSRREPVFRPAVRAASCGRGMRLVSALSSGWGVRLVHHEGKTVWATIPGPRTAVASAVGVIAPPA